MNPDQITSYQQLMVMITSKWISKSIYAAAKLGIADILSEKSANIDEIAELTGTQPAQLYRLLRALSSVGVFNEESPAVFSINTKGEWLKTGNLRAAALLFNSEWSDQSWGKLM
ncbi:MAG: methyltransferase family protein [bacterium]